MTDPIFNRAQLGRLLADVDSAIRSVSSWSAEHSLLDASAWHVAELVHRLDGLRDTAERAHRVASEVVRREADTDEGA